MPRGFSIGRGCAGKLNSQCQVQSLGGEDLPGIGRINSSQESAGRPVNASEGFCLEWFDLSTVLGKQALAWALLVRIVGVTEE